MWLRVPDRGLANHGDSENQAPPVLTPAGVASEGVAIWS